MTILNVDGTNQSDDMGKELQGKIQIYDPKDVVAISGVVDITNAVENASYFVEIHSEVKTSQIASDGSYIIYGVKPDDHTLYIKYSLDGSDTEVASKSIKVSKDTSSSISSDGATIVINELSENAKVNVNLSGNTVTLEGVEISENFF